MYDIALVGGGIMSLTLAKLLKELNPEYKVIIFEALPMLGQESSNAWNNAGTGHAGLCELNYTPYVDGKINIDNAIKTTEAFETSRQFWSFLVDKYNINPTTFIHTVPHVSFVSGKDIIFLGERYDEMKKHHFYKDMEFIDDYEKLVKIAPLLMQGRSQDTLPVAATIAHNGTDINYGALCTILGDILLSGGVEIHLNTKVKSVKKSKFGNTWEINTAYAKHEARFVFIGAGGAAVTLLEKTGIPEAKGYGGFPISGQMLVCDNQEVIEQHNIKAYGKAKVGSPPMSVSHLDTRWIEGRKQLVFGPFPGLSTKFLKYGSWTDLFKSLRIGNLYSMILAGKHNMPLNKYLFNEVRKSFGGKMAELREYYPEAKNKDWRLITAGQRVQIIKKDKEKGGILEFGTEITTSRDGTLAGLRGASPGASTSVHSMIEVIEKCFLEMKGPGWINKMKEMIPSYGAPLQNDPKMYEMVLDRINETLKTK